MSDLAVQLALLNHKLTEGFVNAMLVGLPASERNFLTSKIIPRIAEIYDKFFTQDELQQLLIVFRMPIFSKWADVSVGLGAELMNLGERLQIDLETYRQNNRNKPEVLENV